MMQWMLPDAKTGRWLGLDYVKRNNKAILNVEVIRQEHGRAQRVLDVRLSEGEVIWLLAILCA